MVDGAALINGVEPILAVSDAVKETPGKDEVDSNELTPEDVSNALLV